MFNSSLKRLALVAAAASVCAVANATTTDLGPIPIGPPTPFSGTVLSGGPFLDVFTFTLPTNGGSGYSVVNFPLTIPGFGTFNTVFTTLQLVNNPDGLVGVGGDETVLASNLITGGAGSMSVILGPHVGGSMYLSVGGIANGTVGGLYSGAISVSPVPEVDTYAMLLAGLACVSFIARRRLQGPNRSA